MSRLPIVSMALLVAVAGLQAAEAGAPLKGVDVKLGKNPGGTAAARTTDGNGVADFGVWPKGAYTVAVSIAPGQPPLRLAVNGAVGGTITRTIGGAASARAAPVAFSVDGRQRIVVTIEQDGAPLDAPRNKVPGNSTNY